AEPIREIMIYGRHGLSIFAFGQGSAPATRIVGNYGSKTLVVGTGPYSGLPQARMPKGDNLGGIYFRIFFKIIQCPTHAPGPCGNTAPFILFWPFLVFTVH